MIFTHQLLRRQLRKHLPPDEPISEHFFDLLLAVQEAYQQYDSDRRLSERAMELSSQELTDLNEKIIAQNAHNIESLGVLAGGIAHDFNNLLTIVMANASLAMLDEKAVAAVGEYLRDIQSGAARARDLTQQLITFAKGGSPLRSAVSLPNIVRDTTEFILRGSSARCEFEIASDLWTANVDKDQIAQVVQNIVLNAAQAMPEGGIIRIALGNETIGAGVRAGLKPGRYIRLTISDSGKGVSPQVLPRIFEPYFSTRKTGSGLGLATVYSIIKKHEGHIEVDSALGQGTTFTLRLPAAELGDTPRALAAASACPVFEGRGARVLVMDDEDSILRVSAATLKRMGLGPTLVRNGEEAVNEFSEARTAGRPFSLLIFDLTIPGAMGGKAAIEAIRKIDTQVPAIVSSGYSNDPVMADFKKHGFQAVAAKPYSVSDLTRTVEHLLAPCGV